MTKTQPQPISLSETEPKEAKPKETELKETEVKEIKLKVTETKRLLEYAFYNASAEQLSELELSLKDICV